MFKGLKKSKHKILMIFLITILLLVLSMVVFNIFASSIYELNIVNNGSTNEDTNARMKVTKKIVTEETDYSKVVIETEIANIQTNAYADVAVLLDTSGSMSGNRFTLSKTISSEIVNNMFTQANIGKIAFSTFDGIKQSLGATKNSIIASINNINNGQGNSINGLEYAKNALATSTNTKVVIFITDGSNKSTNVQNKIAELETAGISVYTVMIDQIGTDENNIYYYTDTTTVMDAIAVKIKEKFKIKNSVLTETFTSFIISNFDVTFENSENITNNATGFVWNIPDVVLGESTKLKYTLTLKNGVTVSDTDINVEKNISTNMSVTDEKSTTITSAKTPSIKITKVNTAQDIPATIRITSKNKNDLTTIRGIEYKVTGKYENGFPVFETTKTTNASGEIVVYENISNERRIIIEIKPINVPAVYELSDPKDLIVDIDLKNNIKAISQETTDTLAETSIVGDNNGLEITATDLVNKKTIEIKVNTINKESRNQILTGAKYKLIDENSKEVFGSMRLTPEVTGTSERNYTLVQEVSPALFQTIPDATIVIRYDNTGKPLNILSSSSNIEIIDPSKMEINVLNEKEQVGQFNIDIVVKDLLNQTKTLEGVKYKIRIEPQGTVIDNNLISNSNGEISVNGLLINNRATVIFEHISDGTIYKKVEDQSISLEMKNGVLSVTNPKPSIYKSINKMDNTLNISLLNEIKPVNNQLKLSVIDAIDESYLQNLTVDLKPYGSTNSINSTVDEDGNVFFDKIDPTYGAGEYYYTLNITDITDGYLDIPQIKLKLTFNEEKQLVSAEQITTLTEVTINNIAFNNTNDNLIYSTDIIVEVGRKEQPTYLNIELVDEADENIKIAGALYSVTVKGSTGKKVKQYTTDVNGTIKVDVLSKGVTEISIAQLKSIKGYRKSADKKIMVNISEDVMTVGAGTTAIMTDITGDGTNSLALKDRNGKVINQAEKAKIIFHVAAQDELFGDIEGEEFSIKLVKDDGDDIKSTIYGNPEFSISEANTYKFEITQDAGEAGYEKITDSIKLEVVYRQINDEMTADEFVVKNGADLISQKTSDQKFDEVNGIYVLDIYINVKNPTYEDDTNKYIDLKNVSSEDDSNIDANKCGTYSFIITNALQQTTPYNEVKVDNDTVEFNNVFFAKGDVIRLTEKNAPIGFKSKNPSNIMDITIVENEYTGELEANSNMNNVIASIYKQEDKLILEIIIKSEPGQGTENPINPPEPSAEEIMPYSIIFRTVNENGQKIANVKYNVSTVGGAGDVIAGAITTTALEDEVIENVKNVNDITIRYTRDSVPDGYMLSNTVKEIQFFRDFDTNTFIPSQIYNNVVFDSKNQKIIISEVIETNFTMTLQKIFETNYLEGAAFKITADIESSFGTTIEKDYEIRTSDEIGSSKDVVVAFNNDYRNKIAILSIEEIMTANNFKGNPVVKFKVVFDSNGDILSYTPISNLNYVITSSVNQNDLYIVLKTEQLNVKSVINMEKTNNPKTRVLPGIGFEALIFERNLDGTLKSMPKEFLSETDIGFTDEDGKIQINLLNTYALRTIVINLTEKTIPNNKYILRESKPIKIEVSFDGEGNVISSQIIEGAEEEDLILGFSKQNLNIQIGNKMDVKSKFKIRALSQFGEVAKGLTFNYDVDNDLETTMKTDVAGLTDVLIGIYHVSETVNIDVSVKGYTDIIKNLKVVYDANGKISQILSNGESVGIKGSDEIFVVDIVVNIFNIKIDLLQNNTMNKVLEGSVFEVESLGTTIPKFITDPSDTNGTIEFIAGIISPTGTASYKITQVDAIDNFKKIAPFTLNINYDTKGNITNDLGTIPNTQIIKNPSNRIQLNLQITLEELPEIAVKVISKDWKTQGLITGFEFSLEDKYNGINLNPIVNDTTNANGESTFNFGRGIAEKTIGYNLKQTNELLGYFDVQDHSFSVTFNANGGVTAITGNTQEIVVTNGNNPSELIITVYISRKVKIAIENIDLKYNDTKVYGSSFNLDIGDEKIDLTIAKDTDNSVYLGKFVKNQKIPYFLKQTSTISDYILNKNTLPIYLVFDANGDLIKLESSDTNISYFIPTQTDADYGKYDIKVIIKSKCRIKFSINIENIDKLYNDKIENSLFNVEALAEVPVKGVNEFVSMETGIQVAPSDENGNTRITFEKEDYPKYGLANIYQDRVIKFEITNSSRNSNGYQAIDKVILQVTFDENGEVNGATLLDKNEAVINGTDLHYIKNNGIGLQNVDIVIKSELGTTFTLNLTKYYKTSTHAYEDYRGYPVYKQSDNDYYIQNYGADYANEHLLGMTSSIYEKYYRLEGNVVRVHHKYAYLKTDVIDWQDVYLNNNVRYLVNTIDKETNEKIDIDISSIIENGENVAKFNKRYNGKTIIFQIKEKDVTDYIAYKEVELEITFDNNGNILGTPKIINNTELAKANTEYDGAVDINNYGLYSDREKNSIVLEKAEPVSGTTYPYWWHYMQNGRWYYSTRFYWYYYRNYDSNAYNHESKKIYEYYKQQYSTDDGTVKADHFGSGLAQAPNMVFIDKSKTVTGTKMANIAIYRTEDNTNRTEFAITSKSQGGTALEGAKYIVSVTPETGEGGEILESTDATDINGITRKSVTRGHANRKVQYSIRQTDAAKEYQIAESVILDVFYNDDGTIKEIYLDPKFDEFAVASLSNENTINIEIKNDPDPYFNVKIKYLRDDITKAFLEEAQFRIIAKENGKEIETITTNLTDGIGFANAAFTKELTSKTIDFEIEQILTTKNYKPISKKYITIEFDDEARIKGIISGTVKGNPVGYKFIELELENEINADFTVNLENVDANDTNKKLEGAKFKAKMTYETGGILQQRPSHTIDAEGKTKIGFIGKNSFSNKKMIITIEYDRTLANYKKTENPQILVEFDSYGKLLKSPVVIAGYNNAIIVKGVIGEASIDVQVKTEPMEEKLKLEINTTEYKEENDTSETTTIPISNKKYEIEVYETLNVKDEMNNDIEETFLLEKVESDKTDSQGKVSILLDSYADRRLQYKIIQQEMTPYIINKDVILNVAFDNNGNIKTTPNLEDTTMTQIQNASSTIGTKLIALNVKNKLDLQFTFNISHVNNKGKGIEGIPFTIESNKIEGNTIIKEELREGLKTDVNGKTTINFGTKYLGKTTTIEYIISARTLKTPITIEVLYNIYGKVMSARAKTGAEYLKSGWDTNIVNSKKLDLTIISDVLIFDILTEPTKETLDTLEGEKFEIQSSTGTIFETEETIGSEAGGNLTVIVEELPKNETITYTIRNTVVAEGFRPHKDIVMELKFDDKGNIIVVNQNFDENEGIRNTLVSPNVEFVLARIPLKQYKINITPKNSHTKEIIYENTEYEINANLEGYGGKGATDINGTVAINVGYVPDTGNIGQFITYTIHPSNKLKGYKNPIDFKLLVEHNNDGTIKAASVLDNSGSSNINIGEHNVDIEMIFDPREKINVEVISSLDDTRKVENTEITIQRDTEEDVGTTDINGVIDLYVAPLEKGTKTVDYTIKQAKKLGFKPIQDTVIRCVYTDGTITSWEVISGDTDKIKEVRSITNATDPLSGKANIKIVIENEPIYSLYLDAKNIDGDRLTGGKYILYDGANTVNQLKAIEFDGVNPFIIELPNPAPYAQKQYALKEISAPLGSKLLNVTPIIEINLNENGQINKDANNINVFDLDTTQYTKSAGVLDAHVDIIFEETPEFYMDFEVVDYGTGALLEGIELLISGTNRKITTDSLGKVNTNLGVLSNDINVNINQSKTISGYTIIKPINLKVRIDENGVLEGVPGIDGGKEYSGSDIVTVSALGRYGVKLVVKIKPVYFVEFESVDMHNGTRLDGTTLAIKQGQSYLLSSIKTHLTDSNNKKLDDATAGKTVTYTVEMTTVPNNYQRIGNQPTAASNYLGQKIIETLNVEFDIDGTIKNAWFNQTGNSTLKDLFNVEIKDKFLIKIVTKHKELIDFKLVKIDGADSKALNGVEFNIQRQEEIPTSISGIAGYTTSSANFSKLYTTTILQTNGILQSKIGVGTISNTVRYYIKENLKGNEGYIPTEGIGEYIDVEYDDKGLITNITSSTENIRVNENYQGTRDIDIVFVNDRKFNLGIITEDQYGNNLVVDYEVRTNKDNNVYNIKSDSKGDLKKSFTTIGKIYKNETVTYTITPNSDKYVVLSDVTLDIVYDANGNIVVVTDANNPVQTNYTLDGTNNPLPKDTGEVSYVSTNNNVGKDIVHLGLKLKAYQKVVLDINIKDSLYSGIFVPGAEFNIKPEGAEFNDISYTGITDNAGNARILIGEIPQNDRTINYTVTMLSVPKYKIMPFVKLEVTFSDGLINDVQIVGGNDNEQVTLDENYPKTKYQSEQIVALKMNIELEPLFILGIEATEAESGTVLEDRVYEVRYKENQNGVLVTKSKNITTDLNGEASGVFGEFLKETITEYEIIEHTPNSNYRPIGSIKLKVQYDDKGKMMAVTETTKRDGVTIEWDVVNMYKLLVSEENVHLKIKILYDKNVIFKIENKNKDLPRIGIEGSKFNIEIGDVVQYENIETDKNGEAIITKLEDVGEKIITFSQVEAGEGYRTNTNISGTFIYKKSDNPYKVEIRGENFNSVDVNVKIDETTGTIIIEAFNSPKLLFNIYKTDTNSNRMGNVGFEIKEQVGELTQTTEEIAATVNSRLIENNVTTNNLGEINLDLGSSHISKRVVYTVKEVTQIEGYPEIEPIKITVDFNEDGMIVDNRSIIDNSYRALVGLQGKLNIKAIITNGEFEQGYTIKVKNIDSDNPSLGLNGSEFKLTLPNDVVQNITSIKMLDDITKYEDGVLEEFIDNEGMIEIKLEQITALNGYSKIDGESTINLNVEYLRNDVTGEQDPFISLIGVSGALQTTDVICDSLNREIIITVKNKSGVILNILKQNVETKQPIENIQFTVSAQKLGNVNPINLGNQVYTTDTMGKITMNLGQTYINETIIYSIKEVVTTGIVPLDTILLEIEYDENGMIKLAKPTNMRLSNNPIGNILIDAIIENEYDATYDFFELELYHYRDNDINLAVEGKTFSILVQPQYGSSKNIVRTSDAEGKIIEKYIAEGNIKITIVEIDEDASTADNTYVIDYVDEKTPPVINTTPASAISRILVTKNEMGKLCLNIGAAENPNVVNINVRTKDVDNSALLGGATYSLNDLTNSKNYTITPLKTDMLLNNTTISKYPNETINYELTETSTPTGYDANTEVIKFSITYNANGDISDVTFENDENIKVLIEQETNKLLFEMENKCNAADGKFDLEVRFVDSNDINTPISEIQAVISVIDTSDKNLSTQQPLQTPSKSNDRGIIPFAGVNATESMQIKVDYLKNVLPPAGRIYDEKEKTLNFIRDKYTGEMQLIDLENVNYIFEPGKLIIIIENRTDTKIFTFAIENVDELDQPILEPNINFTIFFGNKSKVDDNGNPILHQTTAKTDETGVVKLKSFTITDTILNKEEFIFKIVPGKFTNYTTIDEAMSTIEIRNAYGELKIGKVTSNSNVLSTGRKSSNYLKYKLVSTKSGSETGTVKGKIVTLNVDGIHEAKIKFIPKDTYDFAHLKDNSSPPLDEETRTFIENIEGFDIGGDGTYSIDIEAGEYDVIIDKPGYLYHIHENITVVVGEEVDLGENTLLVGDITKDGLVDVDDLTQMNIMFQSSLEKGDNNGDGFVDVSDLTELNIQFGNFYTVN